VSVLAGCGESAPAGGQRRYSSGTEYVAGGRVVRPFRDYFQPGSAVTPGRARVRQVHPVLLLPRVHPCRILAADAGVQAGEAITKRHLQGGLAAATVSSTIAR